jgi:hypothetical protein
MSHHQLALDAAKARADLDPTNKALVASEINV